MRDLARGCDWYTRLFGREPDAVPNEREVMWRVADGGWLYVVQDDGRAGNSLVTIAVSNLESAVTEVATRKITFGPIELVGDAGRRAITEDPDGNSLALVEVAQ